MQSAPQSPKSLAHGLSLGALDVVLVQDNRGSQSILRSMISSLRVARLRVYERADDALKDMMIDPAHVAVIDWEMKPMSGHRFTRLLRNRQMDPLCFLPVIVVSGNVTLSVVDRAFTAGVNSVLIKPVAPVVLRRRLEWMTRDGRGYELKGEQYVLAGIEDTLESRVRRTDFADLLRRQNAMQEAMTSQARNAQDMVDRIVNGEVDPDDLDGAGEAGARKSATWNSWAMS